MSSPPRPAAALLLGAAVLGAALILGAGSARAQSSASQAALADGRDALTLYDAGQHQEALETFEKAERQYHTPVFLLYIARCHRGLGHLRVARDTFDRVMGEDLGDEAPKPWIRAQADAKAEREAVSALIPELIVTVAGATEGATLTVDGKAAALGESLELDPGPHTLQATAGERSVEQTVELAAGTEQNVVLHLAAAPAPTPPKTEPAPATPIALPPRTEPDEGVPGLALAGYVLSGLGVVGVAAGIITGVMALDANDSAGAGCDPLCPIENAEDADRALTLAHTSTGSFVVGGTALALGVLFILLSPAKNDAVARTLHVDAHGVGIRF